MTGSHPAVVVAHAVKKYRVSDHDVRGLEDFSLTLRGGEMCALVGVSGSGKSTLLHILGGLLSPDSGSVRVGDTDVTALARDQLAAYRRDTVALVFQEYNLLPMLTAEENVAVVGYLAGVNESAARSRAREALAAMGLAEHADRYPAQMSGGQRQRVAIARALAGGSTTGKELLLADEPTGSLDMNTTIDIVAALRQAANTGLAVLVATHDPAVVEGCDRVVHIRDGRNVDEA